MAVNREAESVENGFSPADLRTFILDCENHLLQVAASESHVANAGHTVRDHNLRQAAAA